MSDNMFVLSRVCGRRDKRCPVNSCQYSMGCKVSFRTFYRTFGWAVACLYGRHLKLYFFPSYDILITLSLLDWGFIKAKW